MIDKFLKSLIVLTDYEINIVNRSVNRVNISYLKDFEKYFLINMNNNMSCFTYHLDQPLVTSRFPIPAISP